MAVCISIVSLDSSLRSVTPMNSNASNEVLDEIVSLTRK